MIDTLTPARPGLGQTIAENGEDAPRWRNLWFLANPPGTVWSRFSHPSREAAEQDGREILDGAAAWIETYGEDFFNPPYDWLAISRLHYAIPFPDPLARPAP